MTATLLAPEAPSAPAAHVQVAVHGADTPRGRELANLLRLHPHVSSAREIACDGSILVGWDDAAEPQWQDAYGRYLDADVLFICLPPDQAAPVIMDAVESGARVIDLTRCLRDEAFGLGMPNDAGDGETAYGLPELSAEELRGAEHVANAGGVATCATLALAPAAMAGQLGADVQVEAVLGMPKSASHARPTDEEVREEIEGNLRELHRCPHEPRVVLEPHADPAERGIQAKARLGHELTVDRIHTLYATFYADRPCVEVLPQGLPSLPSVVGTNKVVIGVRRTPEGEVEVECALDDAIKGSVGQAIQNMNLMFGLPETLGLPDFDMKPPPREPAHRQRRPDL